MMLSATRKADREEMARLLSVAAAAEGAAVELDIGERNITVNATGNRGLAAMIFLDAQLAGHDHCIHWHMNGAAEPRPRLAGGFASSINEAHRRKATSIADTFDELRNKLTAGLRKAADGSAFLPN